MKTIAVAISVLLGITVSLGRADTLTDIKKRGAVNVYVEAQYQPFEFVDQSGKIVGLDLDLAKKVFEDGLQVTVNVTDVAFSGLLPSLLQGKADVIVSAITITKERLQKFDFSVPYFESANTVAVRADESGIQDILGLNGKVLGAQIGTQQIDVAKKWEATELKGKGLPGFKEIRTYERAPLAFEDLLRKRLDAVVDGYPVIQTLIKERPNQFKILGRMGQPIYYGIVLRKGDPALLEYINGEVRKLKKNGSLAAIQSKWFGDAHVDRLPDPWVAPE